MTTMPHTAEQQATIAKFIPVFILPDGEDFETNEDGDIVNDRTRWSGGWFPTAELATEVGIEYADINRLVFVGVC